MFDDTFKLNTHWNFSLTYWGI